ncbi:GTP-binding protein SAR1 [Xylaria arbuscula]|nr:GTP-binding protein SAR1 [Xylaria arbuscula]
MAILDWLYSIIDFFGLRNKQAKILILGLNKAGKSTLLTQLAIQSNSKFALPFLPISGELVVKSLRFVEVAATVQLQSEELYDAAGIIFVVDTTDYKRFGKVQDQLNFLLAAKGVEKIPIAVLGNKIDRLEAVSEEELRCELDLEHIHGRPISLHMCCLSLGQGYADAFRFLAAHF